MLILSRKLGEDIIIAGDIRVRVVAVAGTQVRIGIDALKGVPVDREEVHLRRNGGKEPPNGGAAP